jgi:glycerol-3-phosphate dehydrogenase (NAD(P)+)
MSFKKIGIIGAGSWGTALAVLASEHGFPVTLWGNEPDHIAALKAAGENKKYLPGVKFPANIHPVSQLSEAVEGADVVLLVTPSHSVRDVVRRLAETGVPRTTIFLSCAKGIEKGTGLRMTGIIAERFMENPVAVLSGPSHAEEVGRKMPTAVVIGSRDKSAMHKLQRAFSTKYFRAYTSTDVAGIELGGALKNIFAIAAGVSDGMGMGDNSKAALVTRSLAELIRIGVALGGRRETFQGLSGIGDLMVTCFSVHSRNHTFGERLGKGESVDAIKSTMTMIAEGVPNTLSAYECARKLNLDTPILDQVYAILYENKPPREAMMQLLTRDPRPEED